MKRKNSINIGTDSTGFTTSILIADGVSDKREEEIEKTNTTNQGFNRQNRLGHAGL